MDFDLERLAELAAWAYVIILSFSVLDAMFPIVPSESVVILGGVLAARGDLHVVLVALVAWLGATTGDSMSYTIGKRANRKSRGPDDHGKRLAKMLRWADKMLTERGSSVIIFARFIPGGRTAITFGSGYLGFSRMRFTGAVVLAGFLWAVYATTIGYLGGITFEEHWWAGLGLGLAIAFAVTGAIEIGRNIVHRRRSVSEGTEAPDPI